MLTILKQLGNKDMVGGQLNHIYRISQAQKIIRENKELDETNVAGGSSATSMVPIGDSTKKVIPNTAKIKPKKDLDRKPMVETYSLLNDSELLISTSYKNERELLSMVGLKINESDDVRIVKTRSGDIKCAIALQLEDDGKVHSVRYVDVDNNGKHFKKGIARLATLPNSISFKSSDLEIHRDDIADGLVIK